MLGALLLWYATLNDPANPGVPMYPDALTYRMAEAAGPRVRQEFVDAAIRSGLHSPKWESIDIHDAEAFLGVVTIMRGRAIGRRVPGDPAWK